MKTISQSFGRAKKRVSLFLARFFKKKRSRIGIYGPPNAGKTTLANRIARDWTGDAVGPVSEIPHETRRARKKENVVISGANGSTITIDIVDTPGVTTKIDYHEFLEYGMEKNEAVIRAREATEGVAEAMHWLREDIDGVVYMLDSTLDPFMQVNIMMIGIIESRKLPVIIVANKIDLADAAPSRIRSAFPQHPVVAISGLEGRNTEELYEKMIENFA
jgi:GTPase